MIVDLDNRPDKSAVLSPEMESQYVTREEFNHKIKLLEAEIKFLKGKLSNIDDGWTNK